MLVLSRKLDESIIIDGGIKVTVVSVHGNQVRLGIQAPESVRIFREELCGRPASRKKNGRLIPAGLDMPYQTEATPRETTCRNP